MKPVTLELLTSPGCHVCRAFLEYWGTIARDWPEVTIKEVSVTSSEGQELAAKHMIFASPGIIVNGELFQTGGFDKEKFIQKLKSLS